MPAYGAPGAHAVVTRPPVEQPAAMVYVSARDLPFRGSCRGGDTHVLADATVGCVLHFTIMIQIASRYAERSPKTRQGAAAGGAQPGREERKKAAATRSASCFVPAAPRRLKNDRMHYPKLVLVEQTFSYLVRVRIPTFYFAILDLYKLFVESVGFES